MTVTPYHTIQKKKKKLATNNVWKIDKKNMFLALFNHKINNFFLYILAPIKEPTFTA